MTVFQCYWCARERGGNHEMKFLAILFLLALVAADEDKIQDKKNQSVDLTQNTGSSTQSSLLNNQVFPPTSFSNVFGTSEPVSTLAYTGYNGNISPIQTINPDFFVTPTPGVINGPIQAFPQIRTSPVVNGFPVTGNVFPAVQAVPAAVNAIPSQFPGAGAGILTAVTGVPAGALDANAPVNGVIPNVPGVAYRFLTPETVSGIPIQGLQHVQQVGLTAIPAFTSGILPSLSNSVLQGQNIPATIQQVLKNPNNNPSSVSSASLNPGNISSGPLNSVFRNA